MQKNKIKLDTIGDTDGLPDKCRNELQHAMAETAHNDHMTLVLALNYSGRWEITQAIKQIAQDTAENKLEPENINDQAYSQYMTTAHMPDPELLIRTSGEMRISNFLLWQIAYTELHITPVLWPDFRKEDLLKAIADYQQRDRRFGKVKA